MPRDSHVLVTCFHVVPTCRGLKHLRCLPHSAHVHVRASPTYSSRFSSYGVFDVVPTRPLVALGLHILGLLVGRARFLAPPAEAWVYGVQGYRLGCIRCVGLYAGHPYGKIAAKGCDEEFACVAINSRRWDAMNGGNTQHLESLAAHSWKASFELAIHIYSREPDREGHMQW